MITSLSYIVWNPDITAFHLSFLSIRWYSLCWLVGLLGAYLIVKWLYNDQKIAREKFDPLFLYCFIGVLIGARLGHCLFYEPSYFLSSGKHIVEMILPIHFRQSGGVEFTGYEGLASHGGTIGLILAIILYCRRYKLTFFTVIDNIAIATPLTACFIRLGNLMNSEIIGKPTDVAWAFIFERVDMLPRHPAQLYEALAYLVFFFVGLYFYRNHRRPVGKGFYFGLCLLLIFLFRFFVEYVKIEQVDFEKGMILNMGQLLSIPFVLIGAWCIWRAKKSKI
ncbi:MAG: prolipoprotein diacylglyceryl transferase [Prevotella sp.]|nr:prolipoprotein diacylglyceryl transferase [Prevotella sp.]